LGLGDSSSDRLANLRARLPRSLVVHCQLERHSLWILEFTLLVAWMLGAFSQRLDTRQTEHCTHVLRWGYRLKSYPSLARAALDFDERPKPGRINECNVR
jgi:hypothetical protein